jgi:uncharacterized LabA/DUF88 family protein
MYPANPGARAPGFVFLNKAMKKLVLMIDGGFLRVAARKAGTRYDPACIETFSRTCSLADEELLRVLYYDCAPYQGKQNLPVSGLKQAFHRSDRWIQELARKDLFAVRLGVLKFRGYKLKKIPVTGIAALTDADFSPDFEQKGVDMRIGLDIASYSALESVDRIGLVTEDTDCVPAMKHTRKSGAQVVLIHLRNRKVPSELAQHSDYVRSVAWPP